MPKTNFVGISNLPMELNPPDDIVGSLARFLQLTLNAPILLDPPTHNNNVNEISFYEWPLYVGNCTFISSPMEDPPPPSIPPTTSEAQTSLQNTSLNAAPQVTTPNIITTTIISPSWHNFPSLVLVHRPNNSSSVAITKYFFTKYFTLNTFFWTKVLVLNTL